MGATPSLLRVVVALAGVFAVSAVTPASSVAAPPVAITEATTEVTSKEAMLNGTVNPTGLKTTYWFEYGTSSEYGSKTVALSAGSGVSNIKENAVIENLLASTTYHSRIVASNVGGMTHGEDKTFTTLPPTWSILPFTKEEAEGDLQAVSCPSKDFCIAVGALVEGANLRAVHLNGEEATLHAVPSSGFLSGVSCTSSTSCTAVGGKEGATLAVSWNGSEWKAQTTPNPVGAIASYLEAVSCTASNQCTGTGWYEQKGGKRYTLAERWNGTEWSLQTTPSPGLGQPTVLYGVSCTSSTSCTAAGFYWSLNSGKVEINPMAQRWNGTEWSLQTVPKPVKEKEAILHAISCTSATACTATGRYGNPGYTTLAERWNGTEWLGQTIPNPTGESILYGVSCSSATACTTVGTTYLGEEMFTVGEIWNGTEWKIQTVPNVSGAEETVLMGVSCSFPTRCVAVGYSREERAVGPAAPVVERYE
jgi:hypothetical protein